MASKTNKVENMDESKNQLLDNEQTIPQTDGANEEKGAEIPRVSSEDPGKGECEEVSQNQSDEEGLKGHAEKSVTVDKYYPQDGKAVTVDKK